MQGINHAVVSPLPQVPPRATLYSFPLYGLSAEMETAHRHAPRGSPSRRAHVCRTHAAEHERCFPLTVAGGAESGGLGGREKVPPVWAW